MKRLNRIVIFLLIVGLCFGLVGATSSGVVKNITLGLDLQGGFEILYQVVPSQGQEVTRDLLIQTQAALQKRVDAIGVTEPELRIEGQDRIRVKLAGVTDQEQARRLLATEAHLSFRDVHDHLMMGGDNIVEGSAKVVLNEANQPYVAVKFKDPALTKEITTTLFKQPMVIWLDWTEGDSFREESTKQNPAFISAPTVEDILTKEGTITGSYSYTEAKELADLLNAGALPVELTELSANTVGAKLGEQAMDKAVLAGVIGGLLIILFMIFHYRLPGVVASVTLITYVYLILLIFNWLHATLTLPGIAALVLGVGMAVDANILTYERIKEEIRSGKSILSSFKMGSRRALGTIMDANITTIIAASVLFYFGSSAIQGFAVMLIVSIVVSMLTAVFGTRWLLGLLISSRFFDKRSEWFAVKKGVSGRSHSSSNYFIFDFVKHRRLFFTISLTLIVLGLVLVAIMGLNLGVDFLGGTQLEFMMEGQSFSAEVIDELIRSQGLTSGEIRLAGETNEMARVLFIENLSRDQITDVQHAFNEKYGVDIHINESTVSADIARELARQAIWAILLASVGIIIYVALRFEYRFAIAGVIALFHDALFIVAVFAILRLEVDLTFIAAVLTIVGYSINDTIVIFDRIRENLRVAKLKKADDVAELVNKSIKDTLARSINTSLTVLVAATALYLFGGEGIRNFSFALVIGLLVGTYSSIFIAAQVWLVLKTREFKRHYPFSKEM